MGSITRTALVLACSAALAGGMAVPASAADTTTTVTVETGLLSIAAPASAVLSTGTPGVNSTVTVGNTTVTDARAGVAGWSATVALPALTGDARPAQTIPTTAATYLAATVTPTGTSTLATPATGTDLTSAKVSQSASAVSGNNSATWTAALTVPIPAQVLADTYSALMTQSVS
ncbi:hypothetical protein [Arthrobacter sp.]|uniref:hypothetical protein n=1 Tax=Arthrobacter sp. TaxID=1667 RepID=UPI002810EB92|nr:hypothetical protein [Arthrobacter sp.]